MKTPELRMIPVSQIDVLNPRDRNGSIFNEIVGNIQKIGLKKPIVVTPRLGPDNSERYLLVCGEGRLKAFHSLGESAIPALVVDVSDEDALIMSLAENIARRHGRSPELLNGIRNLQAKGYSSKQIAEKIGLSSDYVRGILSLLGRGEERLIAAVEQGRVPLNTALDIMGAGESDEAVQEALQNAYETGKLRGKQLVNARRLIERRKTCGRSANRSHAKESGGITTSSLIRIYRNEVERQKALVRKAEFTQQRLLFLVGALRQLFSDENFVNLLRAEGLATVPKYLAERVWPNGGAG